MSKLRHHISTSGSPVECVAKQRSCPRGGASTFLNTLGLDSSPKPSVRTVRERTLLPKNFSKLPQTPYQIKLEAVREEVDELVGGLVIDDEGQEYGSVSPDLYTLSDEKARTLEDIIGLGWRARGLMRARVGEEEIRSFEGRYEEIKFDYINKYRDHLTFPSDYKSEAHRKEVENIVRNNRRAVLRFIGEQYSREYYEKFGVVQKEVLEDLGVEFISEERAEQLIDSSVGVDSETRESVKESLTCFPGSWFKGDGEFKVEKWYPVNSTYGEMFIEEYDEETGETYSKIKTNGDFSTTLHELTHFAEFKNVELGRGERSFLNTLSEKGGETVGKYKGETVEFHVDRRLGDYSAGETYEVLTTGLQGLFAPISADSSFLFDKDDTVRHESFVLGLLLASRKK